jgi:hypothetical protein
MAISSISRTEFNRMFAFGSELAPYIGDEVEWYADDTKNVIGVIAEGISGSSWNYTTLRRNVLGDFLVSTLGRDSFTDLQTARFACLLEMKTPYDGRDRFVLHRD